MKKLILFFTIFLFTKTFAQKEENFQIGDTIYFNKGLPSLKTKFDSYCIFIDTITMDDKKLYKMVEYEVQKDSNNYIKSSIYHTSHPNARGSDYIKTYFYKNGKKSSEGKLLNGLKKGKWSSWYKNGNIKSEEFFYSSTVSKKRKESEMISFWDRNGKKTIVDGNGTYIYENDSISIKGFYRKSKKHGKFISFTNEKKDYEEYYKRGKLVKGTSWDKEGKKYTYKETFITPYYPGGNKGIRKHIIKHFKIPEYAFENKISGKILISFKIEKDGKISNINVIKKLCEPCDKEAIRVVKLLKKWKPGVMRGKKVRVGYTLPIRYNIQ